jgi:uncharacterized protein (TIGR03437 family)
MFPRLLRFFMPFLCLLVFAADAAVRHPADGRATATLDEIAKRRESRVPPIAPPRMIHEPERVPHNRASSSTRQPRASTAPLLTTANAPVSYTGFLGLLDNFTAIPPDTTGAVSQQYVVTMLNTQVQIQSRSGVARPNYPITLNAFWSPLGNFTDPFDPRIQYDAAADRWIACAGAGASTTSSTLLVAVSQTGDPGGAWNYFKVNVGPSNWGDYPVLGFNGNWAVVSLNLFRVGSESYSGTSLYVFNKSDLYRGGTGASLTFSDNDGELIPVRDLDNRADTMYFVQTFGGTTPVARISKLQGQPGSESFAGGNGGEVPMGDGWADSSPNGVDFAPQLGSSIHIDTGDSRLQNCVQRNATIWCAQTVFLPATTPTRAAVQWFQLDPIGPRLVQRGRVDDPTAAYFYAYPSIAVNKNTDTMLGFTRFSGSDYATAEFAFRTASDPAGTLEPDVVFKKGEAPYVTPGSRSSSNRWGDYSATLVDPADDLTFWTLQEYATTPPTGQRGQFGTWWVKVTAPSAGLNCSYTLSSTAQSFAAAAASGTVSVTTTAGCPWMAASNVPWLQIASGNPGSGAGSVVYSVAANPDPNASRTGTLTIAGQTLTVSQAISTPGVDLAVTAVSAPLSAEPGQQATISATVVNRSATAAGAFRIGLYLGIGPSVATRDTLLASCAVSGLQASATTSCTRTIALPTSIQPGKYVIGAIADDQAQISDPIPGNNTHVSDSGAITISSAVVRPAFPAQGVVSAANYQGGAIAPGEVVTLFGSNLGPATAQFPIVSSLGVVDTIAGGTRVLFDGSPAPMVYALAGQVSAVVPFAVQTQASTHVQVEYLGTKSDVVTIAVVPTMPAIFTLDRSGKGPGAILNQDLTVNRAETPARRGDTVVIYATGGGAMPGVADGRLAQAPFLQLTQPVSVRIAGAPAIVTYKGVAPGIIAGVLQINAIVPSGSATGAVPIDVTIAGTTSQTGVTVTIQ